MAWSVVDPRSSDGLYITGQKIGIYKGNSLIVERNTTMIRLGDTQGFNISDHYPPNNLMLRVGNDTADPIAILGNHWYDIVTTEIEMWQQPGGVSSFPYLVIPMMGYPFDIVRNSITVSQIYSHLLKWYGFISLMGNDQDSAERFGVPNGFAKGFSRVYLIESLSK